MRFNNKYIIRIDGPFRKSVKGTSKYLKETFISSFFNEFLPKFLSVS